MNRDFALKIFEGFSIERWNDLVRPFDLVEMDKDAEKILRTFVGYSSAYDGLSLNELKALCDDRGITYDSDTNEATLITLLIERDNNGDNKVKKIDTIDYSDVVRYNNWMKNSE